MRSDGGVSEESDPWHCHVCLHRLGWDRLGRDVCVEIGRGATASWPALPAQGHRGGSLTGWIRFVRPCVSTSNPKRTKRQTRRTRTPERVRDGKTGGHRHGQGRARPEDPDRPDSGPAQPDRPRRQHLRESPQPTGGRDGGAPAPSTGAGVHRRRRHPRTGAAVAGAVPSAAGYCANLLEAEQTIPMREPPTARIRFWRSQPAQQRDSEAMRTSALELGQALERQCDIR